MTPRRALLGWLLAALLLSAVTFAVQVNRSPLDDPEPRRQRPELLLPATGARPAAQVSDDLPVAGRRAVIVFVRPAQYSALVDVLHPGLLPRDVDLGLVLPSRPFGGLVPAPVGFDPDGSTGRAYGMPTPRDGGLPVGYALVDRRGLVRYVTLDPAVADHFREIHTLLKALA